MFAGWVTSNKLGISIMTKTLYLEITEMSRQGNSDQKQDIFYFFNKIMKIRGRAIQLKTEING